VTLLDRSKLHEPSAPASRELRDGVGGNGDGPRGTASRPMRRTLPRFPELAHLSPRQYAVIVSTFGRWVVLGAVAGVLAGPPSAIFLVTLRWASGMHDRWPQLLWLLPAAGIGVWWLYARFAGPAERGNNLLIEEVHLNRAEVPVQMIPLAFLAPVVTLLFGGSIASVGAAVQMGGALSDWLARVLRLSKAERRIMLMAGLSGGFGAVIGTPAAGAVFGMEVQSVGRIRYEAIVPCLVSSLVGYEIVRLLGAYGTPYPRLDLYAVDALLVARVAVAGAAFGLCSALFIEFTHGVSTFLSRTVGPRGWLKPFLGGCVIVTLVALVGTRAYVGLSQPLLAAALTGGGISLLAFLWKLVFTGLTVGSGFKGGEITPLFIIGATLGAVLAPALGVPPPLLAAVGFAAVFAGASNTPIASALMGLELFGGGGFVCMLVGTVVSYIFSGHRSIYVTQRVDTPKYIFAVPRRFAARDVMTRDAATVPPGAPLAEVLELLGERQVRSVVVVGGVNGQQVLGIVTTGDLLRRGGLSVAADAGARDYALRLAHEKRARDIMTPDPVSVEEHVSLDEVADLMTGQQLKRLPVVDRAGRFVGVISRLDILRCVANEAHLHIQTPLLTASEATERAAVRGWMRPTVTTVGPDAPLETVLERVVADPFRRVVVVDDEQKVVGIIIDTDLFEWVRSLRDEALTGRVRRWLEGDDSVDLSLPDEITANDLMSTTVHTVLDDARPIDVIQRMVRYRAKRLVVVDRENHLRGLVDRQDMLRAISGSAG
jgi:H+/Cl- antiporter ClcA/CBS-domain-containing membrane protein